MPLVSPDYSDLLNSPAVYINRFEDYTAEMLTTDAGVSHLEDLTLEAVAVGVSLVPVYMLTARLLDNWSKNWNPENRVLANVAIAGGLFHIICEETGVNNWFLTNSVASRKSKRKYWKVVQSPSGSDITLCSGDKCGANRAKGVSHEMFH
jgi:hypothetical protein